MILIQHRPINQQRTIRWRNCWERSATFRNFKFTNKNSSAMKMRGRTRGSTTGCWQLPSSTGSVRSLSTSSSSEELSLSSFYSALIQFSHDCSNLCHAVGKLLRFSRLTGKATLLTPLCFCNLCFPNVQEAYATLAVREMPYRVLARYLVWGNYLKQSNSPIPSVCLSFFSSLSLFIVECVLYRWHHRLPALTNISVWQFVCSCSANAHVYRVRKKTDGQYFGRNFDKCRQMFMFFGMNHPHKTPRQEEPTKPRTLSVWISVHEIQYLPDRDRDQGIVKCLETVMRQVITSHHFMTNKWTVWSCVLRYVVISDIE